MATKHAKVSRWQNDLLPHIVDRLARETPDAIYGLWPVAPASYEAGFRDVTYAQLANVINGLAIWLEEQLGRGEHDVLAYVGPNDVRLTALIIAAVKAGYVLFLTSPRNSPAAQQGLFESLKCRTLVTTDPVPPAALVITEAVKPRQLTVPSVEELLGTSYAHYVYTKTFEQARWDPLMVMHTSGSTGLPKPLIWTQESATRHMNFCARAPPNGVRSIDYSFHGKRILVTVPSFHGAGLLQYLLGAIPFGNVVIATAAAAIPTAQGVVDALRQTQAQVALLVPSVVAELAQNPSLLDYVAAHVELLLYIGGDLPQAFGDLVAAKVPLRCQWGASEVGIPHSLWPTELGAKDWHYIRFHPCIGAVFDEVTNGNYELVIRRDDSLIDTQAAFTIKGQELLEKEYRTRDLFEKHPTVPDAWRWRARADDIIVFLNGEKTNPVSMEQHIVASNPQLSGAIVVGAQRFQAALLLELATTSHQTTAEQAALIERIWPSVEKANQDAPAHARVEKSLILIVPPEKPFIRAGKGTIQRAASIAQYATEIDKLYADADVAFEEDGDQSPPDPADTKAITQIIRDNVLAATGWTTPDESASFFDLGMDSLQALQITRALRRGLRRPELALSTIYHNPTIAQLTAAITTQRDVSNERDMMASFLDTYRGLIHQITPPKALAYKQNETIDVILTGSTGTLGTFVLRALLDRPGIGHVFCLNRSEDGQALQSKRFASAGLETDGLDSRVTFLQADLAQPSLGLGSETTETLRSRVSLIVHNAWPVNFNLGLQSFRPHLAGLVNLFAFSASSAPRVMRVLFVSSVGAVSGRPAENDKGLTPETVFESLDTPHANGYARSKFLSELLCDTAARHLDIPVSFARIGQVAGAIRRPGIWNRSEWLPSLVISSLHMGCLPKNLGPQFSEVDWIPLDLLADVLVDLALWHDDKRSTAAKVFNVRNPYTTAWDTLLPAIIEAAQSSHLNRGLEVVEPATWLSRLRQSASSEVGNGGSETTTLNPAVKLLDFYSEGLWATDATGSKLQMSIEQALAASPALRDISPIGLEWMYKWVVEWIESTSNVSNENSSGQ
ncbi:putative NRPS-like enzyme [Annulohypoxylon truncatum]|uniref:putative NRPS-like enzyme n=1 Tax=Annulohypoxylon truncatum TaxID=327061 RepID=UPI002007A942|nr:putative NRPS-like enzyme [Annulohypoxylon truncatum]KAI1212188.1 putative NRPS-like enzyme [Annulohypoxylon truncatum]